MTHQEIIAALKASPILLRGKLEQHLRKPTDANHTYLYGYVAALADTSVIRQDQAAELRKLLEATHLYATARHLLKTTV